MTVARVYFPAALRLTTTELINDREGLPISDTEETVQRWKEYFEDCINATPNSNTTAQLMHKVTEQEPDIFKEEIVEAIKGGAKNKARGVDNISLELIVAAAGEAGLSWLRILM